MTELFIKILNISITAGWLVLAVVLLRVIFQKAPKWILCLLWGVVALRLLLPLTLESGLSLIPSAEVIPQDIVTSQTPAIDTGFSVMDQAVNPVIAESLAPTEESRPVQSLMLFGAILWFAGVAAMLTHMAVSYLCLRKEVQASIPLGDGIYCCDQLDSPFVLGVFRPRIYIPSGLQEPQLQYVIAHEKGHIQRADHWIKLLGFLLLSVHWFNPLLWLGYILLCRDIEQACDEKVVKTMERADRKGYSEALLACSLNRRLIMVCPLAFGEIGVKDRVKAILSYKKAGFWMVFAATVACGATALCFLTVPKTCEHQYKITQTEALTCGQAGTQIKTCTLCGKEEIQKIPPIAHSFVDPVLLQAPTCTSPGKTVSTCTRCGTEEIGPVEKLGHAFGASAVIKAATCIAPGTERRTCSQCGAVEDRETEKGDHILETTQVTKQPNCTEQGERTGICTVCNRSILVERLETSEQHAMKTTQYTEATCKETGKRTETCTRCGFSQTQEWPKTAHSYGPMKTVEQPTCMRKGRQQTVCTLCGETKTQTMEKTAHSWSGATCLSGGNCKICGLENSRKGTCQYEVKTEKQPNTGHAGVRIYQCSACGKTKQVYFGSNGEYDLEGLQSQLSDYASQRGFSVIYSDNQNRPYDEQGSVAFLNAEVTGGNEALLRNGKKAIDRIYDARGGNVQDTVLWVIVSFDEELTWDWFRIWIYVG